MSVLAVFVQCFAIPCIPSVLCAGHIGSRSVSVSGGKAAHESAPSSMCVECESDHVFG